MYERSVDFSDLDAEQTMLEKMSCEALRKHCRERHLVSEGGKFLLVMRLVEYLQREASRGQQNDFRMLGFVGDCCRRCRGRGQATSRKRAGTRPDAGDRQRLKDLFRRQFGQQAGADAL
jgi:hypothetical protein